MKELIIVLLVMTISVPFAFGSDTLNQLSQETPDNSIAKTYPHYLLVYRIWEPVDCTPNDDWSYTYGCYGWVYYHQIFNSLKEVARKLNVWGNAILIQYIKNGIPKISTPVR